MEYECERKLVSAKSNIVKEKRRAKYDKSAESANEAVTLYDDFSYLYRCVLGELIVFDSNGNLRDRQQAEEGVKVGLMLVAELNHNNITEAVNKVKRTLRDLFHYFDIAKDVVNEYRELPINEEILRAYCMAMG